MTVAFLNGRFFGGPDDPPLAAAAISALDAGFQHGVGLFETMLGGVVARGIESASAHGEVVEGWALHLDEHLERLAASAKALGLSENLRVPALAEAVMETVKRSRLPRARIRATITAGDLSMLGAAQAARDGGPGAGRPRTPDPTVLIMAQPATVYPDAMFDRGVRCVLADARANPLTPFDGHKTLNYWWRLRELQAAAARNAGEALVLSVTNHVCGGCVSNILLIKGSQCLTPLARGEGAHTPAEGRADSPPRAPGAPSLTHPVLPGITRAWAIERLERRGLEVRRQMVSVQDVLDAEEVLLTNSSWGVLPVIGLEANDLGDKPGPIARELRAAWHEVFPRGSAE